MPQPISEYWRQVWATMATIKPPPIGDGPVESYTLDTLPEANTLDDGTLVYVSDAPPGTEFAISDVATNTYRTVLEGGRNWFGPTPFPTDDILFRFEGVNVVGADGATITDWPDASDSNHDANVVVGTGPKIRRGVANGLDAVEFGSAAGANFGSLRTSDLAAVYDDTAVKEFVLVFRHLNFSNTVILEHQGGASSGVSPWGLHNGQSGNGALQLMGLFGQDLAAIPLGAFHRLDFRYDSPGDQRAYKLDANAEWSSGVDFGSPAPEAKEIQIGGRADGSFYYYGQIAFLAGWNRVLAADERQAYRDYIETAYGIAY